MQTIRVKKINIEVLLIILLGFAFLFYYIIMTSKGLLYVNAKIVSIVAMITLSLFIVRDLFKPKRKKNINSYLFIIIPLFMASILPATSVSARSMSTISKSNQQIADTKQDKPTVNNTKTSKITSGKVVVKLKMQGNTIFVNDNNFVRWTEEITNNMVKYKGKKIELTGFVFKSDGFKENEFVPARLMMTCCAADSVPVGILANYDKAKDLKKDTWIKVTGKIKIVDYQGEKTPIIIVKSIQNAVKPTIDYVKP